MKTQTKNYSEQNIKLIISHEIYTQYRFLILTIKAEIESTLISLWRSFNFKNKTKKNLIENIKKEIGYT